MNRILTYLLTLSAWDLGVFVLLVVLPSILLPIALVGWFVLVLPGKTP